MTISPLVQQAKEIATGVYHDIRLQTLSEEKKAIDPIQIMATERLAICLGCQYFTDKRKPEDPSIDIDNYSSSSSCTKCGCVGRFKIKSPDSYCPEKKWPNNKPD